MLKLSPSSGILELFQQEEHSLRELGKGINKALHTLGEHRVLHLQNLAGSRSQIPKIDLSRESEKHCLDDNGRIYAASRFYGAEA